MSCPACTRPGARVFLRRERVPVGQNLVVASREAARAIARGRLELAVCEHCGFVFNAAFDPALMDYGAAYDNTQSCSPAFAAHLDERVRHLALRGATIVEVGCGKGDFLRLLVGADNRGIGFDTSYVGPLVELDGRLRFERRYFGPEQRGLACDVVVCRHVIEHVPAPLAFLQEIRAALQPGTRLYFETPCIDWILRGHVMWDLFYEHCSYFSPGSMAHLFALAGFEVTAVEHVFDGQYLWLEAVVPAAASTPTPAPGETPALARAYAEAEARTLAGLREQLAAYPGACLWGAGAKGVTLANLVDPDATLLSCVVDLNPNKQGRFIPGTGHPIVAPQGLTAPAAFVMNPAYREEIRRLIAAEGLGVRLLDLES